MRRSNLDYLAEEVLTQLEKEELKMLRWGFLGGSLLALERVESILSNPSTSLMENLISDLVEDIKGLTEKIINNLKERKLIFATGKDGTQIRYRTRFSETIRLIYLLKQRFKFKDWSYAPNLVSNIKLELPYRKYPIRDQELEEVKKRLHEESITNAFLEEVLKNLLEHGQLNLSLFQVASLSHLLKIPRKDQGTIIGAGTGSGKTKSFYLPAMTKISESIKLDLRHWTRILGIYPRTELLKDQFREALSEIRKINDLLKRYSVRPLILGSYYGDTPESAEAILNSPYTNWEKNDKGYICPTVICPNENCGDQMVWTHEDIQSETRHNNGRHERLTCLSCSDTIEPENIMLTRKRMEITPPDILFTTTEMLNRKLSSVGDQHVFGIQAIKPPMFVLMDEVHIYNGVHGAHVSYVLRRWRHLVNKYSPYAKIQYVGLSATLPNPQFFFAQLIGIEESECHYITPNDKDMTEEGVEYNLIVRGDPFSSTALLSTSVQVSMLITRMLDSLKTSVSLGAWGAKVFGFTDKLDVINRWYHIELDAERDKVLSKFRDKDLVEGNGLSLTVDNQNRIGQIWNAAKQIDHLSLRNPIKVDITSSQQKGVNTDAKLVIATSTLEVGYNDPKVGAVIQHKAPRNLASFMQRKGRAGRRRGMRPWTIVITSAYGRDRFVYEYPEQLYSPLLPDLILPIRNVYVQRIQAGYAVMDWLAFKLKQANYEDSSMWQVLNPKSQKYYHERKYITNLIYSILKGEDSEFVQFISESLQLEGAQLERILWTPPRSIMLHLLPSLHNHLKMDWGRVLTNSTSKITNKLESAPLSGYIPQNLFSSLSVNEIRLTTPNQRVHEHSLQQGIIEFAPGNVSKRFVNVNRKTDAFWVDPGEDLIIDLEKGPINGERIDTVIDGEREIEIIMPNNYTISQIPYLISDKSTGYLKWDVSIEIENESLEDHYSIPLQPNSSLKTLLKSIDVYIANENQFVKLTRYATEVTVNRKYINGLEDTFKHGFSYKGKNAAIGFRSEVDALVFQLEDISLESIFDRPEWQKLMIEFKPEYYLYKLQTDNHLNDLSHFEIEWLWQICFSSTIAIAVSKQITIEESIEEYSKNISAISIRALDVIFHATAVEYEANEEDDSSQEYREAKLYKRLLAHIENESIIQPCIENLCVLSQDLSQFEDCIPWIRDRLKSTVAATIQSSIEHLLPDINTENIIVDILEDKIIFSELDSGGTGIITGVASAIRNYPGQFEELCHHALEHCPRHNIASGLTAIIDRLDDEELRELFFKIRTTERLEEQQGYLEDLQIKLSSYGITPKKELVVSLITKLLNSNSNEKTDPLMKDLHDFWLKEESRLECKIDARIFSVACLRLDDFLERIHQILHELVPMTEIDEKQVFLLVETLLWNNCYDSCPECLNLYSPYHSFSKPSRILASNYIKPTFELIHCSQSYWKDRLLEVLHEGRSVKVISSFIDMSTCRKVLLEVLNSPIDFHFEHYYPYVAAVENQGTEWVFHVKIREVSHA